MSEQSRLSRQTLLRLVAPLMVAILLGLQAQSASAGIGWCRSDPLVTVNGRTGHVYVDSTFKMYKARTGPIRVVIHVPVGSKYSAVPLDNGFGKRYAISFVEDVSLQEKGKFSEVFVRVLAPASDSSLPVRVTFHSDDKTHWDSVVYGYANEWIPTGVVKI